ncbi:MAG: transposase [Desulfobacteraceae bacterium]|nr:transposase [Desulfobacteraceae bacterium]
MYANQPSKIFQISNLSSKISNSGVGKHVFGVPAQYTSQECSVCDKIVKKSPYRPFCSFAANRDYNAAINIMRIGRRYDSRLEAPKAGEQSPAFPALNQKSAQIIQGCRSKNALIH